MKRKIFYIIIALAACATLLLSDFRDPRAEIALGQNYETGKHGVTRDAIRAASWYLKAARKGDPIGQLNAANMYLTGKGLPQDDAKAFYWYQKAARQGNAEAQVRLGLLYLKGGDGFTQNDREALHWFAKAAAQGRPEAQYNYGLMYAQGHGVGKSEIEAAKWYRSAAEQGLPEAQYATARAYYLGAGVDQDMKQAGTWFHKAADQNMAEAQFNLAVLYEKGDGVPQSRIEAAKWYGRAAANGIDTALRAAWLQGSPERMPEQPPAPPVVMNLPPPVYKLQEPALIKTAAAAPARTLPRAVKHRHKTVAHHKPKAHKPIRLAGEIIGYRTLPSGRRLVYERIASDRMAGTEIGIYAAD